MKPTTSLLVLAAAGALALAACQSAANFAPPAQTSQMPMQTLRGGEQPSLDSVAHATSFCSAPTYKPPGPFYIFIANGKGKRTSFQSVSGKTSLWIQVKVIPQAHPVPSPSATPTTPPTSAPFYIYLGSYKLAKSKQQGCALLYATANHKPFAGSKDNAFAVGVPIIKYPKHYKFQIIAHGPLTETLTGLSATGGSGTAVLQTTTGSTVDTAHVTLSVREGPIP